MFSVYGEQIKSLGSKQSKFNFLKRLHQNIEFMPFGWHKQPPDDQTTQVS